MNAFLSVLSKYSSIDRYKTLPLFNNRVRFFMDIQAELLDAYAKKIESAVNAFESLIFAIRAVPGAMISDDKSHATTEGLKRLCRWWNSASYVNHIIKEWGEDPVRRHLIRTRNLIDLDIISIHVVFPRALA
jgi:hypothetical protein